MSKTGRKPKANDEIPTDLDWSRAERGRFASRLKGTVAAIMIQGDLARALDDVDVPAVLKEYHSKRSSKAPAKRPEESAFKSRFSLEPRGNLSGIPGSGDVVRTYMLDESLAYKFDSTDEIEQALREYLAQKAKRRKSA